MRIVFAGTPETALPSLRALVDSRHDVAAVLTRPDAAAGRGRHLRPSPVAAFAREQGIEVLTPPTQLFSAWAGSGIQPQSSGRSPSAPATTTPPAHCWSGWPTLGRACWSM